MKILAVDDNSDNLAMLQSLLEGHGHKVLTANNGEEAMVILKEQKVDLVISDILMPVMDGFALCREIRKDDAMKQIPFITYTATYTGKKDEEFAREIGSDEFIVKPCEPDELIERIDNVMERVTKLGGRKYDSKLDESEVLKLYNERLIRKLERKMADAEREVQAKNKALEALKRSEELLNTTQRITKLGGWQQDLRTGEMYWTDELFRLHEMEAPPDNIPGDELVRVSLSCYAPEDCERLKQAFELCKTSGKPYELECKFTTLKGKELSVITTGKAVMEQGVITKVFGSFQDVTQQRIAEHEQGKLRNQLMQVQKLDSIGRLAGGVAHDFNNILTVIMGYTEEILRNLSPSSPFYGDMEQISKAGIRASSLVRQLLTFSRKQSAKAELMQLNHCLEDIHKMLMRLIGEDIIIDLELDPTTGHILADVGQIEQIIINLGINAREAMLHGGNLHISTKSIHPEDPIFTSYPDIPQGDYVMLKSTDTGCGMDENTLEHIFEPFYTTKRDYQGTGLGLATVYGIVIQSNAHIRVESTLGKGSSFIILFPSVPTEPPQKKSDAGYVPVLSSDETILVVEDDQSIRHMIKKMIQKLGYEVTVAETAEEAIRMLTEENLKPDLLITDVVMAGMNGLELVEELLPLQPKLKLILMSGYTERVIGEHGNVDSSIPFLQKPFTRAELGERIRQALKG